MAKFNPGDIELGEDGSLGGGMSRLDSESQTEFGLPIIKASQLTPARLVPIGPFIVDYACFGGAPDHSPIMFHGVKSSGKSTLTLHHIKELQVKYPDKDILYGAVEKGCFQPDWAAAIGVDLDRLHVVMPQYGEEFITVVEDAIKKNKLSQIIVDSTPELLPADDVEKSAEDNDRMAANSLMCGKLIKKYNSSTVWLKKVQTFYANKGKLFNPHIPGITLINQRREAMNSRFPTANLPGGKRLQHFPLMTMELRGSDLSDESSDKELVKSTHTFNLGGNNNKNKATGRLIKTGEFDISTSDLHPRVGRGQIDDFATVIKYAKRYGLTGGGAAKQTLATYPDQYFKSMGDMGNTLCGDEQGYWLTKACIIALARIRNGMTMMPPDDYLQRCNGDQIMEVLEGIS